jgi:hypothetical protein
MCQKASTQFNNEQKIPMPSIAIGIFYVDVDLTITIS